HSVYQTDQPAPRHGPKDGQALLEDGRRLPRHPEAPQLWLQRAGGQAFEWAELPLLSALAEPRPQLRLPAPGRSRATPPRHDHAHLPDRDPGQRLRGRPPLPPRSPPARQHPDGRADLLMATRAPSVDQIAIISAFTLSCVAILIYLWATFGGSIPLKPNSYE